MCGNENDNNGGNHESDDTIELQLTIDEGDSYENVVMMKIRMNVMKTCCL